MSRNKWIAEVYLVRTAGEDPPVITLELKNPSAGFVLHANIPSHKYIIEMPASAAAADRIAILDLRAQCFDIAIRI